MNEKIKIGLLGVIAVALIVNAYFLASDRGVEYASPAEAKASFERGTPALNAEQARKDALAASVTAIDPLQMNNIENVTPSGPVTTIQFKEMAHDFGTIKQDSDNKKIFKFTNTGSEPLIIENAKGSCGCTVPQYPKEPIAPGQTGEIEVVYKPGKQKDQQSKNVTITANTTPANTVLTISANVLEIPS